MRVHMDEGASQIGRPVTLLDVVVETEQILRAVPARLNGDLQEAQPHRLGVSARQQALAGARNAGEHRHLRRLVDLERSVKGVQRPPVVLQTQLPQMLLDLEERLFLKLWIALPGRDCLQSAGELREIGSNHR